MVGMNNRFPPGFHDSEKFIEDKALGKLFYAKAGWFKKFKHRECLADQENTIRRRCVLDLGIVMLDLAFWMMGFPEVKEVSATNYSHHTKDVEDSSIAFLKMNNGSTLTIEASWSLNRHLTFFTAIVLERMEAARLIHFVSLNVCTIIWSMSHLPLLKRRRVFTVNHTKTNSSTGLARCAVAFHYFYR